MSRVSVFLVAGARPNFMKVAPIHKALVERSGFSVTLVHTGQHYDGALSDVFFTDLQLPRPQIALDVGSGSHGSQTAKIIERFESVVVASEPDLVIVVGDVNSTIACALAAAKVVYRSGRRPKIAHVEAGLRSFDRSMPEEINRVLTDTIADFLFTTEEAANENLAREGVPSERVFLVGNVMIDTLLAHAERAAAFHPWEAFGLREREYAVLTLHRPSNVDDGTTLSTLLETLIAVSAKIPIVFPAHPRTTSRLMEFGFERLLEQSKALHMLPPLGYLEFLSLMSNSRMVLTDSGGIQEETTILGIPCLTLRENTERPITLTQGTNVLVGTDGARILTEVDRVLTGEPSKSITPALWDGQAAERVARTLERCL